MPVSPDETYDALPRRIEAICSQIEGILDPEHDLDAMGGPPIAAALAGAIAAAKPAIAEMGVSLLYSLVAYAISYFGGKLLLGVTSRQTVNPTSAGVRVARAAKAAGWKQVMAETLGGLAMYTAKRGSEAAITAILTKMGQRELAEATAPSHKISIRMGKRLLSRDEVLRLMIATGKTLIAGNYTATQELIGDAVRSVQIRDDSTSEVVLSARGVTDLVGQVVWHWDDTNE